MSLRTRLATFAAAAAALGSVGVLLVLAIQIDRTRDALQSDAVSEFQFAQQLSHNLDEFVHALIALQHVRGAANAPGPSFDSVPGPDAGIGPAGGALGEGLPEALAAEVRERYEVVYSLLIGPVHDWRAGTLKDIPAIAAALERMQAFVLESERSLGQIQPAAAAPADAAGDADLRALIARARNASVDAFELGVVLFHHDVNLRDQISARLTRLGAWFRAFAVLLALAGMSLYLLMRHSARTASQRAVDAQGTRCQLEVALDEVTSADLRRRSQDRYLATALHDLRQPLQALQFFLTALAPYAPATGPGRRYFESCGDAAEATQGMLSGLLDIARLDAGALEPVPEALDATVLLRRLAARYAAEAEGRGLSLRLDLSDALASERHWVRSDERMLERVLGNLISNALAYTPAGRVTLALEASGDARRIIVRDTGIGIPQRELDAIFHEYHRLDAAVEPSDVARQAGALSAGVGTDLSQRAAGFGLGLSIVRRLARLLDIDLEVTSELGRGTRFSLTLPPAEPTAVGGARQGADDPTPTVLAGLAVLIIDDNPCVRDGVTAVLRQNGCHALPAADAAEACRQVVDSDTVPDLILADYHLGDSGGGLAAIDAVRDEVNQSVPAILITGDTDPALHAEARRLGVPLLHKPVRPEELFQCIRRTLVSPTIAATALSVPPAALASKDRQAAEADGPALEPGPRSRSGDPESIRQASR